MGVVAGVTTGSDVTRVVTERSMLMLRAFHVERGARRSVAVASADVILLESYNNQRNLCIQKCEKLNDFDFLFF